MTFSSVFRGWSLRGRWHWHEGERARWLGHLSTLSDGEWEITAPKRPTRSQKANAYYWGVVLTLMAEHTGHSPDEIHDVMCQEFIPSQRKQIEFYNKLTGETDTATVDLSRSSKLEGESFWEFVENVRDWARRHIQVDTPDPDPSYREKR